MTFDTTAKVSLTLEQVLEAVRQLPAKAKLKVAKELEREGIEAEWDQVFKAFRTTALKQKTIDQSVEAARAKVYAKEKAAKAGRC